MINFAFFGTDEFSVGVLDILKEKGFLPSLVVTVPDKPKGRKMLLTPPPTKVWAQENKVEVTQPATLKNFSAAGDLFVIASYGKIIPKTVLDLPKHGTLNVHPSLLPKYRGATPLESAILGGDQETGVTIMLVDEEMDHGEIVASKKYQVASDEVYETLRDNLAKLGGETLAEVMPKWVAGEIKAEPQNHDQATYTKKIVKEDGLIDLDFSCATPSVQQTIEFYRKIRAFHLWPGTYFLASTRRSSSAGDSKIRVIIKSAHLDQPVNMPCRLVIDRVVPEGKKEMDWSDFARNL